MFQEACALSCTAFPPAFSFRFPGMCKRLEQNCSLFGPFAAPSQPVPTSRLEDKLKFHLYSKHLPTVVDRPCSYTPIPNRDGLIPTDDAAFLTEPLPLVHKPNERFQVFAQSDLELLGFRTFLTAQMKGFTDESLDADWNWRDMPITSEAARSMRATVQSSRMKVSVQHSMATRWLSNSQLPRFARMSRRTTVPGYSISFRS